MVQATGWTTGSGCFGGGHRFRSGFRGKEGPLELNEYFGEPPGHLHLSHAEPLAQGSRCLFVGITVVQQVPVSIGQSTYGLAQRYQFLDMAGFAIRAEDLLPEYRCSRGRARRSNQASC